MNAAVPTTTAFATTARNSNSLFDAVYHGNLAAVREALKTEDPFSLNDKGLTALHIAITIPQIGEAMADKIFSAMLAGPFRKSAPELKACFDKFLDEAAERPGFRVYLNRKMQEIFVTEFSPEAREIIAALNPVAGAPFVHCG